MPGIIQNRRLLLPGSASVTPNTYGATLWLKGDYATEQSERARDFSGQGNHGAIYSGRAMQFDGVADYIIVPDGLSGVIGGYWGSPAINMKDRFGCYMQEGAFAGWIYAISPTKTWANDTPMRLVYVMDDGGLRVFVDGELFASNAIDLSSYLSGKQTTISVYISVRSTASQRPIVDTRLSAQTHIAANSAGAEQLECDMADFQIWTRSWTAADVLYDYQNPEKLASDNPASSLTTSDLAGWWPLIDGFNDSDWDLVLDASGNGNHGTNVSAGAAHLTGLGEGWPQMVYRGWSRAAISATGAGYRLVAPSGTPQTQFFVAAWVTVSPNATLSNLRIFDWTNATENKDGFIFGLLSTGEIRSFIREAGPAWSSLNGSTSVNDGDTHLVAFGYDGSDTFIYLDNTQEGTDTPTGYIPPDGGGTDAIGILRAAYAASELAAGVLVHEIVCFDTFLDTSDRAELYNSGNPLDATAHSQAANLVGYWRNTGRATLDDLSGNGNDVLEVGTLNRIYLPTAPGSTVNDGLGFPLTNPRDVEALNWDSDGYATVADDDSLDISGDQTFVAFIKTLTTERIAVFEKIDATGSAPGILVSVLANGKVRVAFNTNASNYKYKDSTTDIADGSWHSIICTWDHSEKQITIYIDGVDDGGVVNAAGTVSTLINALDLVIGHGNGSWLDDEFKGNEGDISIIPSALTAAQVTDLYNAMKGKYSL